MRGSLEALSTCRITVWKARLAGSVGKSFSTCTVAPFSVFSSTNWLLKPDS